MQRPSSDDTGDNARGVLRVRLREVRERAGFSNASAFGREIGVTPTTVYRLESGTVVPSIETLREWARVTGCTTDYLLGLSDEPTSEAA